MKYFIIPTSSLLAAMGSPMLMDPSQVSSIQPFNCNRKYLNPFIALVGLPFRILLKMGHSRPLFLYSRLLNTVDSKQHSIKLCDVGIRTVDLWCWRRPLYQLSHHHCLSVILSCQITQKPQLVYDSRKPKYPEIIKLVQRGALSLIFCSLFILSVFPSLSISISLSIPLKSVFQIVFA